MSFFIRKSNRESGVKRKKGTKNQKSNKIKRKEKSKPDDLISSDDDLSGIDDYTQGFSSEEETEQEKKLRLTKKYLQQIEEEELAKNETEDARGAVSQRLKDEALEEAGRLQKKKAHEYEDTVSDVLCVLRGHKLSVTCLAVSQTEKFLISASKDGSIIKWSIEEKKKIKTIPGGKKGSEGYIGHTDQVLAISLSTDDKFLATGGRDKIINIWNPDTMERIHTFRGHKDAITGLVFQKGSHQLISASSDRSLKLWTLDEMGYIETLFGHQDAITDIDCFFTETALTAGARDNTVRIWKIVEESQLVFQANGASIDCVCVSSYQSFVSGGDDGSLLFWGIHKKKPMFKVPFAHGCDPESEEPNWITSLCALQNTDLVASGSNDGYIRLWKRDDENHSLIQVSEIKMEGFVNSLRFTPSGKYLVAAVGQEHRLGRWRRIKPAKNCVVIYCWNKS
ncbi:U3 small nucleolar RNA-interacting protein 2 [Parasteatoda tepidariorum]|uniref:U3 small nucleolar RNA-interacting protein 2 n=1 Tax=Parasteatoda tepidariorum TaxID=114398 RepID=UPI00077F9C01|nr:U3 small nucleolar RNA-interacting protein 2 [Parasteatoda tepidariorum]